MLGACPTHEPAPTDECRPHPQRVCSWRRCHLPSGLEEQPQSEHPHWQMAHARGGTASPVAAASPGPPLSCCPVGPAPCEGLPLRALQWLIRPASHRRWSRLAAPAFLDPSASSGRPVPAHSPSLPCPSLSFPLFSNICVPQKSSPTHAVTGVGRLVEPRSAPTASPLGHPTDCEAGHTCRPWEVAVWAWKPVPLRGRSLHTPGPGPSAAGTASQLLRPDGQAPSFALFHSRHSRAV